MQSSARASWYELPEDTKEDILACLPLESLCRSRAVSQEWNALFTSTRFITNKWAEALPNKKPWLVLCEGNNGRGGSVNCWRYSFFTQTWKNCMSFSFLPQGDKKVHYVGSAQGLFLVDLQSSIPCNPQKGSLRWICNPLTGAFLELPPMSSIKSLTVRGIVGWKVGTQETYKVVAVGTQDSHNKVKVEIYDSFNKSWGLVACLPQNFVMGGGLPRDIVFCNGFFYCMIFHLEGTIPLTSMGVLGFSILEGTFTFIPLPQLVGPPQLVRFSFYKLLVCGSRILLALIRGFSMFVDGCWIRSTHVILWEFQKDSSSWKEIARSSCERIEESFDCVGMEDCVCFADCENFSIYNLNEDTWSWLPTINGEYGVQRLMAFTPRPDRKVW